MARKTCFKMKYKENSFNNSLDTKGWIKTQYWPQIGLILIVRKMDNNQFHFN